MNKIPLFLSLIIISLLVLSCDKEVSVDNTAKTRGVEIIVVNYPLFYFTQYLVADLAKVTFPVPDNIDPADWKPQLEDTLKLQQADLIILNGSGYSNWLDKVSLSSSKLLDSSRSITSELIPLTEQTTHSHGPKGDHSHSAYAFTLWMDPELAKKQVFVISQALAKRWPQQKQAIQLRETELIEQLTKLDTEYQEQASRLKNTNIIYSHPVYQYFARRYHLNGQSLHWEPNVMPSEKQWNQLKIILNRIKLTEKNSLFIWEDFPTPEIAKRLSLMGVNFVVIRPAANSSSNDWLTEQQSNLKRLKVCCDAEK